MKVEKTSIQHGFPVNDMTSQIPENQTYMPIKQNEEKADLFPPFMFLKESRNQRK